MRPVYVVAGGVSRFAKARPDKTFPALVKEAYDFLLADLGIAHGRFRELLDSSVASYFTEFFTQQVMAGAIVQDYLGLCPKPSHRVEGGGATGGICFQEAWKGIASGDSDVCLAYGFELMSYVNTAKGNEFIALASDVVTDYPVGGFYTGYYAMMVSRHMKEFGTTPEQMALVAVKAHANATHNRLAQAPGCLTVEAVRGAPLVAWPLTRLDCCTMTDGAAAIVLASEEGLGRLERAAGRRLPRVRVAGIGRGTDAMRLADRGHGGYEAFLRENLLPHEDTAETRAYYQALWERGARFPGVHSCRAGRMACKQAYARAGVARPRRDLSFVELHDAFTSSEIQTYEDLGLCRYGEGGPFVASGAPFVPDLDYGLNFRDPAEIGSLPVNPSGGLIGCAHPIGATGLMQAVFALWQLQGTISAHFGAAALQIKDARRGAIHSHAGTGTYVTVSILEKEL